MKKRVLIIFMKNPELGKVKSRLAKDIGEEKALKVYNDLLDKCRIECIQVDAERQLHYHLRIDEEDEWNSADFAKFLQVKGELGEKMSSAIGRAISEEEASVVLIGSDCYDLDHNTITTAFEALNFSDLVLGPANDGGYYLIGMNQNHNTLFENIDWSTDRVLEQTVQQAERLNLSYFILEELIDLDTFDDLKKSGYPSN